jgi:hypothetical protein
MPSLFRIAGVLPGILPVWLAVRRLRRVNSYRRARKVRRGSVIGGGYPSVSVTLCCVFRLGSYPPCPPTGRGFHALCRPGDTTDRPA